MRWQHIALAVCVLPLYGALLKTLLKLLPRQPLVAAAR